MEALAKDSRRRKLLWAVFGCLYVLLFLFSLSIGRYVISSEEIRGFFTGLFSNGMTDGAIVLLKIRLPRVILASMAGAALSMAGVSFQSVFQNALASPDILGASSGAAFGASIGILFNASGIVITALAFFFGVLSVFMAWFVSERGMGRKSLLLLLSGLMVGALYNAGTGFIKLIAEPTSQLQSITYWMMGSLSGADSGDVLLVTAAFVIGGIPLLILGWRMNLLSLGEEEARALGLDVSKMRILLAVCATLLTAATVSVTGIIGWVGLVIPHFCRRLVGNNGKVLVPFSILSGATFLLLIDDISRTLLSVEIPIGILTAFIGAPFFLFMIVKKGNRHG